MRIYARGSSSYIQFGGVLRHFEVARRHETTEAAAGEKVTEERKNMNMMQCFG